MAKLTLDEELLLAEQELIQTARMSLFEFTKNTSPCDYEFDSVHLEIIAELEKMIIESLGNPYNKKVGKRPANKMSISCPPRIGKSELMKKAISWTALNWGVETMFICYNQELANTAARDVKIVLAHPYCKKMWPEVTFNRRIRDAVADFYMTNGAKLRFLGVGGTATGLGANVMIVDDTIKNIEEALNKNTQDKLFQGFQANLLTRLAPSGSVICSIATRWSEFDLPAQILKNDLKKRWKVKVYPALSLGKEHDELNRPEGEGLLTRMDADYFNNVRSDLGEYTFGALFQQNPVPAGGNLIQKDWIKWIEEHQMPRDFEKVIISLDCSQTKTGDPYAATVIGKKGSDYYFFGGFNLNLTFREAIGTIKQLIHDHSYNNGVYIERTANGAAIIETLQETFSGIIDIYPVGSKENRLQSISHLFEGGNIYFVNMKLNKTLEYQLIGFPAVANDDVMDAAVQGLKVLANVNSLKERLQNIANNMKLFN